MISEDQGPVETSVGFTDAFLDAGVAKLDALFGEGYARANPEALSAYITTCARNLGAFMTAATSIAGEVDLDEALAALEEALPPPPAPRHKGRRR